MDKTLVSIIVPVYNVEGYLERCIKSIIDQTYKNLEIIAINDGSTDNSGSILKNLQKSDNRLKILEKSNGGQASARNLGLENASGDYYLFVDSDDYLDKEAVQLCISAAVNNNSDLVVFDYFQLDSKGRKLYRKVGHHINSAMPAPWNKFYSSKLWKQHRFPEGYWYEDLGIVPIVVAQSIKLFKLDKALYYYESTRDNSQTKLINELKLNDVIVMAENVYTKLDHLELLSKNLKDVELLFIEHLVYDTFLHKIPYIKTDANKKRLINEVCMSMKQHFPSWEKTSFKYRSNTLTNFLGKAAIKCYLNNFYLLGDAICKLPKKIRGIFQKIHGINHGES